VYAFILNGLVTINGHQLNSRDGFERWYMNAISVKAMLNSC
jgi:hypothetical protein